MVTDNKQGSLLNIFLSNTVTDLKNTVPIWFQKKLACCFFCNAKEQHQRTNFCSNQKRNVTENSPTSTSKFEVFENIPIVTMEGD